MKSTLDKFKTGDTWWWTLPGGFTVKARFDHIFYNNLYCTHGEVIPEGDSDHYPVFGDFEIL